MNKQLRDRKRYLTRWVRNNRIVSVNKILFIFDLEERKGRKLPYQVNREVSETWSLILFLFN